MNQFENFNPCKAVDVKEVQKTAEITDPYKNLRYKVLLESFDTVVEGNVTLGYRSTVWNYFSSDEPFVVARNPGLDEPLLIDYCKAVQIYEDYVRSYSNLVKAENRDHQDIEIYKENINYKKIVPQCCSTCSWCRRRRSKFDFLYEVSDKLECTNPLNRKVFDDEVIETREINRCIVERQYGHKILPDDGNFQPIYPTVDPFGVCENYLSAVREQIPVPGQSMTKFIDMRLGQRLDGKIKNIISTDLSGDLSSPVIQSVTMILSSSEASVVLSAPIVNLVTNSQAIQTQTVNVIGNALSTNVLSDQMFTAVSSTFENPEMSAALETPVARALETPAAKTTVVNTVGTALSDNALSDAMTPAVANVIPTSQVSGEVSAIVNAVNSNIVIGKITGQDGLTRYIDANGNGQQDADEPDIPDEEAATVILGGDLGA